MRRPSRDDLQAMIEFSCLLLGESTPRALVIIGAARLEEEVKSIAAVAIPGTESDRRSHSSRLEILTAIGLLASDVTRCLKRIAKIRNHFAHTSRAVSITDPEIRGDLDSLLLDLEGSIGVGALSEKLFESMIAKIPFGGPPRTWMDGDWKRLQVAILALQHHLVIVRCNVPSKPTPIALNDYDME